MNLARSLLTLHSHSQDERNREFNSVFGQSLHNVVDCNFECIICHMKFFIISTVTDRDITDQNSLNFKIHLRSAGVGYILIFALNIAALYYSRLVKMEDTKHKLSYTYHSEIRIEN